MIAIVDYQQAYEADEVMAKAIPSLEQIEAWANAVLVAENTGEQEITVRFTDDEESQTLNHEYRGKDKPTNVLSFPFEVPPGIEMNLLGDLVICVPVIMREAEEQDKTPTNHYAHMVVHGILHLLGYSHDKSSNTKTMEDLERKLLSEINISNPYIAN